MADTVLLHIGLPKTATSYLQGILWSARDQLRADGVLLPGRGRADHLWLTKTVCRHRGFETATPAQQTAHDRVIVEARDWAGTALVTHEFLASATAEQAERLVAAFAPARVHVVVTAREPLGLFTASWQESLKNRGTLPMAAYPGRPRPGDQPIWDWHTLDLTAVLDRWGGTVPPERVHVLPLPRGQAPRDLIWRRFAGLLGVDAERYDSTQGFANSSMGVVEADTLRRVNADLTARGLLKGRHERGTMIRSYLADERLVPRDGERFWPHPSQVAECRERGERAFAVVGERGFDVVGDPADLLVPADLPERRTADEVAADEVAAVATDLVAQLLADVYALRRERNRLNQALAAAIADVPTGGILRRLVGRLRRPRRSGRRTSD